MKKSFTKLASVAIIVCVAVGSTVTFQSCSQDAENIPVAETQLTTEQAFAKDLQKLANAQRKLAQQMFVTSNNRRTGELVHDCTIIPVGVQTASQEVVNIIGDIVNNYDLTEDLTEHEIEGLIIDEEQREIMALNPNVFFDYIEEYKSNEFNDIVLSVMQNPNYCITAESIIQNNNLKMNEKIDLILTLIGNRNTVEVLPNNPLPNGPAALVTCEDFYSIALGDCAFFHFVRMIGVAVKKLTSSDEEYQAAYNQAQVAYQTCNNQALASYNHCRGAK